MTTVAALALLVMAPSARGAESGKNGDSAKAAALAHFETATRLFEVREYGRALEEYKEAYLAKPDPAFLFNIGQCHRKLGQNLQAMDFYQQFLRKAPLDDPNRHQVEVRIADIQADEQEKANRAARADAVAEAPPPTLPPLVPKSVPWPEPAVPIPATSPVGAEVSVASSTTPRPETRPIYERWWFWTGIGAVVVAGTVTAIYLGRSDGGTEVPSTSLGNRPVFP